MDGGHYHVVVGCDEGVFLATDYTEEGLSLCRFSREQQYIQLGVRIAIAHEVVVCGMVEGEVFKVELGNKVGEKVGSPKVGRVNIGITSDINRKTMVLFLY